MAYLMGAFTEDDFKTEGSKVIFRLQKWRWEDHEDNITLSRNDVCVLLDEIIDYFHEKLKG